jgi:signal transduction histidine kinase
VLDYAAAAFCAVLLFVVLIAQDRSGARSLVGLLAPRDALLGLLALGLSVPVAIRRRVPVRSLVIVLAGCLVILIIGGQITRGPFLPLAVVLYLVASTCRRGIALAGLAGSLVLLIAQGVVLHFNGQGSGNATGAALVLTIFWMAGYLVQQRRTHMAAVRDRAASDAVTRERLRIARELHDVVAHSMTVVTVQAGFGEYVFDTQPAEARAALGAIQAVSREALGEMQRMLCVLRQTDVDIAAADAELAGHDPAVTAAGLTAGTGSGGTGPGGTGPAGTGSPANGAAASAERLRAARFRPTAPLAPAPGLANLDRLVERTAGAGVTVTVERIGEPRSLPASLDLSAFRIVQESLTNVVKHSGADRCHVVLEYSADSLLVEVTDPGAGPPADVGAPARASVPAGATVAAGAAIVLAGTSVPAGARISPGAGPPAGPSAARAPGPVRPPIRLGSGPDRAGHGIIGMRERVSLCGGELHALPRPGGGFVVRARLPLRAGRP